MSGIRSNHVCFFPAFKSARSQPRRNARSAYPLKRQVRSQVRSRDLPRDLQANVSDLAKRFSRGFPCFGVAHVVQKFVSLPSQPVNRGRRKRTPGARGGPKPGVEIPEL